MIHFFTVQVLQAACWINSADFGRHEKSLVFIHGSGGQSGSWVHQYAALHRDYNVVAVNLPGHGQSEGKGLQSVDAYVLWLNELLSVTPLVKPVLVGHSLGAAIALAYAASFPNVAGGVVPVGGGVTMPVNPDILEGLPSNPDLLREMICKISLARENRPALMAGMLARLTETPVDVLAGDLRACSRVNLADALKRIVAPVCVICGNEDKMMPPAASREIAALVPGATLSLIEGAGHMVMMEKPDEFNRVLTSFLVSIRP